jgi:hypothetical protein
MRLKMNKLIVSLLKTSTSFCAPVQIQGAACKQIDTLSESIPKKNYGATLNCNFSVSPLLKIIKLAAIVCCVSLSGCQTTSAVQPWEKGNLAKPEMTFELDKLDSEFVEHTYSSKEGSSGGAGVGGGGCGCN